MSIEITQAEGVLGQSLQGQPPAFVPEAGFDPLATSIPSVRPAAEILAEVNAQEPKPDPLSGSGFVRPSAADATYVATSRKDAPQAHAPTPEQVRIAELQAELNAIKSAQASTSPQPSVGLDSPPPKPSIPYELPPSLAHQDAHTSSVSIPVPPVAPPTEASLCDSDSAYFEVSNLLPSGLHFQQYERLSVRRLRLADHIKIASAVNTGSMRNLLSALGACIDRNWNSLPFMDMLYLAFWLRLNSYRENKYSLEWACRDTAHNRDVFLGSVAETTLHNRSEITETSLNVKPIDWPKLEDLALRLAAYGLYCAAPTVQDFIFVAEGNTKDIRPEDSFLAGLASFLSPTHGATLLDRLEFLKKLVAEQPEDACMDVLSILQQIGDVITASGVSEKFTVTCAHCQSVQEREVEIDLMTFFPFGK